MSQVEFEEGSCNMQTLEYYWIRGCYSWGMG